MRMKPEGYIDISFKDLGVEYQDEGPWRSYELNTNGTTIVSLELNATISEVDQDGGELRSYDLNEAPKAVQAAALKVIREAINAK